ncbi:MAG: hypothetical protein MUE98_14960 [Rhodobacteraceae bacterium]|nr:hypothetical protein [Paracoccaceae bacterium]
MQEAERRLREAADAARRHVARIASIQSALTEAARLVTLLARLATVF